MELLKNIFKLMRPKQWIKNFFVFGGLLFSYSFLDISNIMKATGTFLLFCLISSTVYIMNDILDVEKDKVHPKKKTRPIASGAVTIRQALIAMFIILAISMIGSYLLNPKVLIILVLYLLNNILYSFKIKHIVILDVTSIAIGFCLRVIAGGVSINVHLSSWILLCTFFIALFLGFEKRKNEILKLDEKAGEHRKILGEYSVELLEQFTNISMSCTLVSYVMYTAMAYNRKFMMATSIFVVYGLFRYKYLIISKGEGGSPTETVLTDKSILINVALWAISSAIILPFCS